MEVPLALHNQVASKNAELEELENLEHEAKIEAENYLEGVLATTKKEAIRALINEYREKRCDHCFFMRYLENLEANPDLIED
mmetsp:Transcript_26434/g.30561  ORF Transcript_26434/g.30561 Transcript_26434/m.30561 type:complete len:82 (-) Transcript_26434:21-266(-)